MPIVKACNSCGQKNRVPACVLQIRAAVGLAKRHLQPAAEPLEADPELFNDETGSRDGSHNPLLLGLTSMSQNESSHSGM
jgi:hypothetical protein